MTVRHGTSHFMSRDAAIRYYRPYHYPDTALAVDRKLREGEIHIGQPTAKPGESVKVDIDGRYWIDEAA